MLTNPFSQVHPALWMLFPEFPLCHLSMGLMQICYMMTVCMSYNAYHCSWWTRWVILLWLLRQRIEWLSHSMPLCSTTWHKNNTFAGGGAEASSPSFSIWNENYDFYTEDIIYVILCRIACTIAAFTKAETVLTIRPNKVNLVLLFT